MRILYEDNHAIVVHKPVGTLVQRDLSGEPSLADEVKAYLKERDRKPGGVFLGIVHRLDRPVEGVVLFAKTTKGASRFSAQFRRREVEKEYHALVIGRPSEERGALTHYLLKDRERNMVTAMSEAAPGALLAELSYEVLRSGPATALIRVSLGTGRSHQIRAQLSAIGCPILGDVKYGAPEPLPNHAIALAATKLTFTTATTGERVEASIPVPGWFFSYSS